MILLQNIGVVMCRERTDHDLDRNRNRAHGCAHDHGRVAIHGQLDHAPDLDRVAVQYGVDTNTKSGILDRQHHQEEGQDLFVDLLYFLRRALRVPRGPVRAGFEVRGRRRRLTDDVRLLCFVICSWWGVGDGVRLERAPAAV